MELIRVLWLDKDKKKRERRKHNDGYKKNKYNTTA